jgi:hypothetical protein
LQQILVFKPSLKKLKRLLEAERYATSPWFGHFPFDVPPDRASWVNICAPRNDPGAARRLFPNASNALRDCRIEHGGASIVWSSMIKACESKLTDQSIFNHVFLKHAALPSGYNDADGFHLDHSHIVHFVGTPKPWDLVNTHRGSGAKRLNATRLWRHRCAGVLAAARVRSGGGGSMR